MRIAHKTLDPDALRSTPVSTVAPLVEFGQRIAPGHDPPPPSDPVAPDDVHSPRCTTFGPVALSQSEPEKTEGVNKLS